jgi:hypothetical protein
VISVPKAAKVEVPPKAKVIPVKVVAPPKVVTTKAANAA